MVHAYNNYVLNKEIQQIINECSPSLHHFCRIIMYMIMCKYTHIACTLMCAEALSIALPLPPSLLPFPHTPLPSYICWVQSMDLRQSTYCAAQTMDPYFAQQSLDFMRNPWIARMISKGAKYIFADKSWVALSKQLMPASLAGPVQE